MIASREQMGNILIHFVIVSSLAQVDNVAMLSSKENFVRAYVLKRNTIGCSSCAETAEPGGLQGL